MQPLAYRRVLLKLSGEALGQQGIDPTKLDVVVREIRILRRLGCELAIVIGGGNIWRKREQGTGMDSRTADYLGLLATVMNTLALQQALRGASLRVLVQLAIVHDLPGTAPPNVRAARTALARGTVVIFGGGTGQVGFTTDTAAAQRAHDIGADVIVKAGPVDGVYTADPRRVRGARQFWQLTLGEALRRRLGVMDRRALVLCRRYRLPVVVCRWGRGAVVRVVRGGRVGTLVTPR